MRRISSLVASSLLLTLIILSTSLVALIATPTRGQPLTSTLIPITSSVSTNTTKLAIDMYFPNGTRESSGEIFAGAFKSTLLDNQYVFDNIIPGIYSLNTTGIPNVYLPSTSVKVIAGLNSLNITAYQIAVFPLTETPNLSFNGTQPGPTIIVKNNTAVMLIIHNNTTLIHNVAVVSTLYDTNYSTILFNSLSNTITAGGSVNDTFIVSRTGTFYYECLIGNHAKDGEFGLFIVE